MAAIAKAAAELFNQQGYIETSIADIAAAAEMSRGGIFHYFPSKNEDPLLHYEQLYGYLILDGFDEDLKHIEKGFPRIGFVIARHVKLFMEHPSEAKTLLHEAHNLPQSISRLSPKKRNSTLRKWRKYWSVPSTAPFPGTS